MRFMSLLVMIFGVLISICPQTKAQAPQENPNNQVLANGKMAAAFAEIMLQAGVPASKIQDDPNDYYILEQIYCEDGPQKVTCQAKVGATVVSLPDPETMNGLLGLFDGVYSCAPTGKAQVPELCTTSAAAIACNENKEITDILNRYVCLIIFKEPTQPSVGLVGPSSSKR